jgi:hypothetical protein
MLGLHLFPSIANFTDQPNFTPFSQHHGTQSYVLPQDKTFCTCLKSVSLL